MRTATGLAYLFAAPLMLAAYTANAAEYNGTLSYVNLVSSGFYAENDHPQENGWEDSSVLTWLVSNEEAGAPSGYTWFYSYKITVADFAPVRWMIETGSGFNSSNIDLSSVKIYDSSSNLVAYDTANISFGNFSSSTTGLSSFPEERYGMFWAATGSGGNDSHETTLTFWSNVAPEWGDLYANCGGNGNRGWNSGFLTSTPLDAAASGSIQNHVLTPGTVPEPASVLLIALTGACGAIIRQRKRKI
ncbi:MAG: PEP-CTERM sorting domain-containing protein [Opitutales bacterium]|nr:PEP-CTERM sorting domain-containing protein [Opitutales bacterium]